MASIIKGVFGPNHRHFASVDAGFGGMDLISSSTELDIPMEPPIPEAASTTSGAGGSGLSLASGLVSVVALAGCSVGASYAYSSYKLYKKRQLREVDEQNPVDEVEDVTAHTIKSRLSDFISTMKQSMIHLSSKEEEAEEKAEVESSVSIQDHRKQVVLEHQKLLKDLQLKIPAEANLNVDSDDNALLQSTIDQLSELFLVSVVGEFNSGKSAFINSLLGGQFVQEGILPTTDHITKISYGEQAASTTTNSQNLLEIKVPVPWLKEVNIVDTPGTNALFELGHQAITERFLPHSDLVLFVTSAERPLTESERQIIRKIKEWDRKIVVVVNKCDMLSSEHEQQQVMDFVRGNLEDILPGNDIPIYGVSARQAIMSKIQSSYKEAGHNWQDLWMSSNIGAVENYMFHSLDGEQKLKCKLSGPLAVANRFIGMYEAELTAKRARLDQELRLLDDVDRLIEQHCATVFGEFRKQHLEQLDHSFSNLMDRADSFVDHHVNVTSWGFLLQPQSVQGIFREEVCVDFQSEVETMQQKLLDWLTETRGRLVERVQYELNTLSSRSTNVNSAWKNAKPVALVVEADHQLQLQQFREGVRNIISKFTSDERHSRDLVDSVRSSFTHTVGVEACAALMGMMCYSSLSTWLNTRNGTGAADRVFNFLNGPDTSIAKELARPIPMLGMFGGTVMLAATGLNIMHFRRALLKRKLSRETGMCQTRLRNKLEAHVKEKAESSVSEMVQWLQPFLHAIKSEQERVATMMEDVKVWRKDVSKIENLIGHVTQTETIGHYNHIHQEAIQGNVYPVSPPLAYPLATPMGPVRPRMAGRGYSDPPQPQLARSFSDPNTQQQQQQQQQQYTQPQQFQQQYAAFQQQQFAQPPPQAAPAQYQQHQQGAPYQQQQQYGQQQFQQQMPPQAYPNLGQHSPPVYAPASHSREASFTSFSYTPPAKSALGASAPNESPVAKLEIPEDTAEEVPVVETREEDTPTKEAAPSTKVAMAIAV